MKQETRDQAFEYCSQDLSRESCGLVIIEKGREKFVPCRNISEIPNQFEMHPDDYAKADERGEITRIIHSHPYQAPTPSEADKVSCEATQIPWAIVSVPTGQWYDFEPIGYKAPLIGREWAHGVLDCYSLIRDYYKETYDIILPDFDRQFEWWLKGQDLYIENFKNAGFYEVPIEAVRKGDVLLMQIGAPCSNHGAVYLGDEKILHHLHKRLSCREVFGGYYLKHTTKVLRHEKN